MTTWRVEKTCMLERGSAALLRRQRCYKQDLVVFDICRTHCSPLLRRAYSLNLPLIQLPTTCLDGAATELLMPP